MSTMITLRRCRSGLRLTSVGHVVGIEIELEIIIGYDDVCLPISQGFVHV